MKTIERLKLFIDYKAVSLTSFDKLIGAGNGYIGKQIKKGASIGSDMIEKIVCTFPDINIMWLITGEGEMLVNEQKYVTTPAVNYHFTEPEHGYNTNTPGSKSGAKSNKVVKLDPPTDPPTNILTPQFITVDNQQRENILYVPVKAAAGYLLGFSDREYIESLPSFSLPGLKDATYRAFEVDGDSMYPTLENKEMVIGQWVEKIDYIREDRVHIIVTKNRGIIVKRLLNRVDKYGYIIAKSDAVDNRGLYPNIEIHPDEIVEIWYAVWHGSFNFKSPTEMYKKVNNLEADLTEVLRVLKENNLMA